MPSICRLWFAPSIGLGVPLIAGPFAGGQVIQIRESWAVVRKPGLLLLCKRSFSIGQEHDAGIGPVEDEPVFELAQLGGPSPELEQGTGQVLLPDLLAGEPDGQPDLDQAGGRSSSTEPSSLSTSLGTTWCWAAAGRRWGETNRPPGRVATPRGLLREPDSIALRSSQPGHCDRPFIVLRPEKSGRVHGGTRARPGARPPRAARDGPGLR